MSFWFERNSAAVAGKKAFVTNRVGDVGFLLAMFLIFASYRHARLLRARRRREVVSSGTATAIALLLLAAAIGKSAQIPLHLWLPDAMEGPTPVSALIHAATMVTAGVFLLCRAHAFLDVSSDAMTVVAWVGGITALLAGTVAIMQPDIKRVLAYSTISQLGYMFLAVGIGAYSAAVFMVICHAFYKGCLFLGAGSVIHGNHDNQDMRIMGRFRKFLPYTAFGMVVAWLAIAGLPPLSGFFSKDEIITTAFLDDDYGLWIIALVAAVFTGLLHDAADLPHVLRQRALAAGDAGRGSRPGRGRSDAVTRRRPRRQRSVADGRRTATPVVAPHSEHPPHESPWIMVLPILVLARSRRGRRASSTCRSRAPSGSTTGSNRRSAGVPVAEPSSFVQGLTLEIGVGRARARRHLDRVPALPQGARTRRLGDPLDAKLGAGRPGARQRLLLRRRASRKLVDGPGRGFANFLDRVVDQKIIDGTVDGIGGLVKRAALGLRHVQDGLVRRYALGIAFGAVALLLYLVVRAG